MEKAKLNNNPSAETIEAEAIRAKSILSVIKGEGDTWFGLKYNMNLYRGCQHGCIYCDSRSTCYRMEALHQIFVKENALDLLKRELSGKRQKGTIGFGSMNDPYMPLEAKYEMTRQALEIIADYKFPVHIITKSNLVLRDIELLKRISEIYAAVSVTITTFDDDLCRMLEPNAPVSSKRFEAIEKLSDAGIYTGITLMPILPFINDTTDNIINILEKAKASGAQYVTASIGVTLREGSRDYYYQKLDALFPGIKAKYQRTFGLRQNIVPTNFDVLLETFKTTCKQLDLPMKMAFYKPKDPSLDFEQLSFKL